MYEPCMGQHKPVAMLGAWMRHARTSKQSPAWTKKSMLSQEHANTRSNQANFTGITTVRATLELSPAHRLFKVLLQSYIGKFRFFKGHLQCRR